MRLSLFEQEKIIETFLKVFEKGYLYLFGSRVDDSKKGGDIDLYIVSSSNHYHISKKVDFLALLKHHIGEQKIDLVFAHPPKLIDQQALKHGILLCKR
jgi:predicted nucleotidyltransferase